MASSVLVLGAGLSGLACAFDLARAGRDVQLFESAAHAGGVVGTRERDGYRFELGPHTLQASSQSFRGLCGDLGLAGRLVTSGRHRTVGPGGGGRAGPGSLGAMIGTPLLSLSGKLRIATEVLRRYRPPADGGEPDMQSFLVERLGREAALRLGGAFVRGVYAAELQDLGAASAFPRMYGAALQHGGLVRGLARRPKSPGSLDLLSFPGGLQELVDALARALGPRLHLGEAAISIERAGPLWRVRTNRALHEAHELVLALPLQPALELLRGLGIEARELALLRHAHVVLVHSGYARAELSSFPRGFGFLVPPPEAGSGPGPRALGMIFASNLFEGRAPAGCVSVAGFYRGEELEALDEGARIAQAGRDLALALGLARTPEARVGATRSWKNVIPRYSPGHRLRVRALCSALAQQAPGVHLAGPWVDGVSVEAVIARGRAVASAIAAGASSEPAP
jgi:oxygen-dependent protoporphyrinogen oxidase